MEKIGKVWTNLQVRRSNLSILGSSENDDKISSATPPQLGFRVIFHEKRKQLIVKVIGAKCLPTTFNFANILKSSGFLIKVTLFPGREKYETKIYDSAWPTINEEFTFNQMDVNALYRNKFISLTVYAVIDKSNSNEKTSNGILRQRSFIKKLFSFDDVEIREKPIQDNESRNNRLSISNARTVGTVTYNLERKNFTQEIIGGGIATPDIWRDVKEITSGVLTQSREGTKGNIELSFLYGISEDRQNDVLEVCIKKFRCNLETMRNHERLGGQLYIKITASDSDGDVIEKLKSDKFNPTISLRIEASTATLRVPVHHYNLQKMRILIRLLCKPLIGKKELLSRDRKSVV